MVENRKFFNDPEYIIPFFSEVISRMGWKLVIDRRNSPPCPPCPSSSSPKYIRILRIVGP